MSRALDKVPEGSIVVLEKTRSLPAAANGDWIFFLLPDICPWL